MSFYEQPQRILLPAKVGYIALTLVLALLFNLLPWRDVIGLPDMVALVLTFWCVHQPRKVGIGIAWFVGLLMDAGNGALLGALSAAAGARRIVELGTALGYTALWLAHGAPDSPQVGDRQLLVLT